MAANFRVTIDNQTPYFLNLIEAHLVLGQWTFGSWVPPQTISPNSKPGGWWQSESNGFLAGTEGYVIYQIEDNGDRDRFYIHWDSPYWGNDTTDEHWQVLLNGVYIDCDSSNSYELTAGSIHNYNNYYPTPPTPGWGVPGSPGGYPGYPSFPGYPGLTGGPAGIPLPPSSMDTDLATVNYTLLQK